MQYHKKMQYFLACSLLLSTASFAMDIWKPKFYLGVDAQQNRMSFAPEGGRDLFRKKLMQENGYLGFEVNDYLGLEAGFESTLQKTKTVDFSPGDIGLGFIIPGTPEIHTFKNKLSGWHVSLLGFSPWLLEDHSVRFLAGIGFARKRIELVDTFMVEDGIPLPSEVIDELRRTLVTHKTLLRLTAGVQKMLHENWGVRATINFENTNKFRYLKSKENPTGITTATAKNSVTLGLGVLYKF